jgi:hypothetical protein
LKRKEENLPNLVTLIQTMKILCPQKIEGGRARLAEQQGAAAERAPGTDSMKLHFGCKFFLRSVILCKITDVNLFKNN